MIFVFVICKYNIILICGNICYLTSNWVCIKCHLRKVSKCILRKIYKIIKILKFVYSIMLQKTPLLAEDFDMQISILICTYVYNAFCITWEHFQRTIMHKMKGTRTKSNECGVKLRKQLAVHEITTTIMRNSELYFFCLSFHWLRGKVNT